MTNEPAIDLQAPFRRAVPDDAPALAELINFAGEGLPAYLWQQLAEPGETAWQVGERRARREEGSFSYRNAIVAEADGAVAACLVGYRIADRPAPIDPAATPAMFLPLQELEALAPGTWYVNVLATYPERRGQGLGTGLLELAEAFRRATAARGLSLIVADSNEGARRLYRRVGFVERARRPMVKEAWPGAGVDWVLMTKAA